MAGIVEGKRMDQIQTLSVTTGRTPVPDNQSPGNSAEGTGSHPTIITTATPAPTTTDTTIDSIVIDLAYDSQEQWDKIHSWFNELTFYSKVFQFFGEELKEQESSLGWLIIIISSFTSFITLFRLDPFELSDDGNASYDWSKSILLTSLSITTTLIAAWMKKEGYVRRIKEIDKRIGCLESFLGRLDYQIHLVPIQRRENYFKFITERRDEYTDLSIYTNLISPSELMHTVYNITRYNAPMVQGIWPWYDPKTKQTRPAFSQHIIDTYDEMFSYRARICSFCGCEPSNRRAKNPLLHSPHSPGKSVGPDAGPDALASGAVDTGLEMVK